MSTEITNLGIKVTTKGIAKAKKEIKSIGVAANKVKKAIGLLGGALAVLGVAKALKASIKYTASIEDLRIQLKFLTGSTKNASKAFAEMTKFASKTPFSLREIQLSTASLLVAVGNDVDKLGDILEVTGEISVQFGLSFLKTSEQLQRAMSSGIASADIFREKGVSAMMGFRTGVSYSMEETTRIINEWAKNNKGAIDELKDTFTGKVSMMGDAWDKLLLTFGEAGVLNEAKDSVQEMTDFLKDPETIKGVENMARAFVIIAKFSAAAVNNLAKSFNTLGELADMVKMPVIGEMELKSSLKYDETDALSSFKKSMKLNADFAKSERDAIKEAEKLKKRQELGVDKVISKVFNITEKLTKKRKEFTKITDAQSLAEKILGKQMKDSKITMEQYTDGINKMTAEIQNYKDVVDKIAFDEKMEKMAQSMENSITDSLMNMGQGLSSFKDLASSIFRQIAAEMLRVQIAKPLASAASGFLGNMFGSMFGAPSVSAPISDLRPPTFAGGGFTGGGSRSGGVDGQGGFLATLHPNETVIDHAKGGQTGGNVTNISVSYSPQVNALDPRTAAMVIAENAPVVVGIIRQAFNRNGQSVSI